MGGVFTIYGMLPLGAFEHIWNVTLNIGWCIWPYIECYCQYWVVYLTIYGMLLMDMLPLEAVVSDSPCKCGGGGPTTPWLMICSLSCLPLPPLPISHVITSKSSMPGSTNTTVMVPRFKFIAFSVDGRMLLVKDTFTLDCTMVCTWTRRNVTNGDFLLPPFLLSWPYSRSGKFCVVFFFCIRNVCVFNFCHVAKWQ